MGKGGGDNSLEQSPVVYRAWIQKAKLHQKTNFKTDSFSRLFTALLIGVFRRLLVFETKLNRLQHDGIGTFFWGGGNVENVNKEI